MMQKIHTELIPGSFLTILHVYCYTHTHTHTAFYSFRLYRGLLGCDSNSFKDITLDKVQRSKKWEGRKPCCSSEQLISLGPIRPAISFSKNSKHHLCLGKFFAYSRGWHDVRFEMMATGQLNALIYFQVTTADKESRDRDTVKHWWCLTHGLHNFCTLQSTQESNSVVCGKTRWKAKATAAQH